MKVERIGDATLYCGLPVVVSAVFCPRHDFKVFNSVVGFVAVLVVHNFVTVQRPSDVSLHYHAMLTTPGVLAMSFRCQRYVTICVVRFSTAKVPVILATLAYNFALKAAAAFCDVLPKRPSIDGLFGAAVTSAFPVMQPASLFSVRDNQKPPVSVSGQIRDLIGATIL